MGIDIEAATSGTLNRFVGIHVGVVGQRYRAVNEESPALPAARARSVSIGALQEILWTF